MPDEFFGLRYLVSSRYAREAGQNTMSQDTPLLIYDGDCGVCTRAVRWIEERADVELRQFDDLNEDQIQQLPGDWRDCAHFIHQGKGYSCGRAMEEAFLLTDHWATGPLRRVRRLPGFGMLREIGYRRFADNRSLVGRYLN